MSERIYFIILIPVIILVMGIFIAIQIKKQRELRKKYPGFPKGYWMNQGIGIGIAIGAGIGVALGNIAIGVGVGVAIGAGIGSQLETKHKAETRPWTEEEKKLKKQSILFIISILLVGIVAFVGIYFIAK